MPPANDLPRIKGDALVVLLTLAAGPMHGYAIMLDAEERSGGEIRLQTGLKHGFIYRPLAEWIGPVVGWAKSPPQAPAPSRISAGPASAIARSMRAWPSAKPVAKRPPTQPAWA